MFFYGEDSVTDNLSPYIDAAPKAEQKYFLATQQVDEARHAVFFHRFFKEVIGAGDSISSTLAYTEPQLSWGYRNVFDRLDRMADDLRRDRSLPNFARAIALYHMVVEATLAQPGQHFIEDYFANAGTMPGFSEGMANVSRDEQRHIGFGVKVLSELLRRVRGVQGRRSPSCCARCCPTRVAVFSPPDWDARVHPRLRLRARGHLRLRAALGADQVAGDRLPDGGDARRAARRSRPRAARRSRRRQIMLLEAGVMGEPNGRPDSSPEIQDLLLRPRSPAVAPHRRRQRRADDDPVALRRRRPLAPADRQRLDRRSARAGADADLTIESSWQDWIEVSTKGADPRRLRAAPAAAPARLAAQLAPRCRRSFPRARTGSAERSLPRATMTAHERRPGHPRPARLRALRRRRGLELRQRRARRIGDRR